MTRDQIHYRMEKFGLLKKRAERLKGGTHDRKNRRPMDGSLTAEAILPRSAACCTGTI
jgi:hypothetical protein